MNNRFIFKDNAWLEFNINKLFNITRGKRHTKENRIQGNTPYYSASSINNGLTDMISNPIFIEKNKVIITTFGDAFYVQGAFTASDEVVILSNKNLNKYTGLFVVSLINRNKYKYSFAYKAFITRIEKQKILLPIKIDATPDWQFIEEYMREIETKSINKYINHVLCFKNKD